MLLALIGFAVLIISGRAATGLPATVVLAGGGCGAPVLAVLNLYLVLRDWREGQGDQAGLGALLSAGALFVGSIPWMGVD